jgi:probable F420-dependent oxidoreductase
VPAKFGVSCGGDQWQPDDIRAVEEFGYDSFWTGEHIVYHRPILESVTALTYAAALTSRIRIGPATMILPLRHPTIIAKQISSLDVLSNGRVTMTIGVGGDYPREFAACDVPMSERGRRATESIEIMRKYWSGDRFDYDGKIFQLKDVDMLPMPVQPGGPPIWVSGRQKAPMKRAALLGDGWHPYMYTPERCRDSFSEVKAIANEAGRTLPDDYVFAIFIYVCIDDDVDKARETTINELKYRYDQEFDHLVDKYAAYGPPDRIIEMLAKFIDAGVNYFIMAPIMPPDNRRAHLERLASEVLPELEKMEPGIIR